MPWLKMGRAPRSRMFPGFPIWFSHVYPPHPPDHPHGVFRTQVKKPQYYKTLRKLGNQEGAGVRQASSRKPEGRRKSPEATNERQQETPDPGAPWFIRLFQFFFQATYTLIIIRTGPILSCGCKSLDYLDPK